MSIDVLQDRIRKMKTPSVIDFGVTPEHLPQHLLDEEGGMLKAYVRFCRELMEGLKTLVPAVRFSFSTFALMSPEGMVQLSRLLQTAKDMGYYVILDAPAVLSPWDADRTASLCFREGSNYPCDGLVVLPYIGSDAIKPFIPYCNDAKKDLYLIVRTANKSAQELQDLQTGTRLAHVAAMDTVKRFGENLTSKCGYSRVCALASATAPTSLRTLRGQYNRVFLLVDGLDYPSGNAKNCSFAFDQFGHGAAVCAGPSVTAAWLEHESDGRDYVDQAVQAAQRMKKNLTRYIAVL